MTSGFPSQLALDVLDPLKLCTDACLSAAGPIITDVNCDTVAD